MTARESKETGARIKALVSELTRITEFISQAGEDGMYFKAGPSELEFDETAPDSSLLASDETLKQIRQSANRQKVILHEMAALVDRLAGAHPSRYKDNLDDDKILALHRQSKPVREIAKLMGCSPSTISRRLKQIKKEGV